MFFCINPLHTLTSTLLLPLLTMISKKHQPLSSSNLQPLTIFHFPFHRLPEDVFFLIFSMLLIPEIMNCRSVCKSFYSLLNSKPFFQFLSNQTPLPLTYIALGYNKVQNMLFSDNCFNLFDPNSRRWGFFDLSFFPYRSLHLLASSGEGRVYLWGTSELTGKRTLLVCNPLTRQYRPLPELGSAWTNLSCKVLVGFDNQVIILTKHAVLRLSSSTWSWTKIALSFCLKLKSPLLVSDSIIALNNAGTFETPKWKLRKCTLNITNSWNNDNWVNMGPEEWADQFDNISIPRLVRGQGNELLMIGAYRTNRSYPLRSTEILIKRLDLDTLEWKLVGTMPKHIASSFGVLKLKVFGGGDRVIMGTKGSGMIAMWDGNVGRGGKWSWMSKKGWDNGEGIGEGCYRGFMYESNLQPLY